MVGSGWAGTGQNVRGDLGMEVRGEGRRVKGLDKGGVESSSRSGCSGLSEAHETVR